MVLLAFLKSCAKCRPPPNTPRAAPSTAAEPALLHTCFRLIRLGSKLPFSSMAWVAALVTAPIKPSSTPSESIPLPILPPLVKTSRIKLSGFNALAAACFASSLDKNVTTLLRVSRAAGVAPLARSAPTDLSASSSVSPASLDNKREPSVDASARACVPMPDMRREPTPDAVWNIVPMPYVIPAFNADAPNAVSAASSV